ncbi:MAG: DUF58 domain-containing protein [Gloeobacteraceae cyanobacterium ES-bin-144]|nr:DUF58 domain-containing protein [Verrucomicrobiales bacterium]
MSGFSDFLSAETMRRLDKLALGSRRTAEGGRAGRHTSVLKGASVEFRDHRDYVQGDSLRHLDWKLFGRSERYYIKQFQEETSLRVHLVIDASASMAFKHSGSMTKYEFARELSASAAYIAHHQQDSVGLVIYDDQVRAWLPTKGGSRHIRHFLESLSTHKPGGRTDTGKALEALAEGMSRRGLVLMMSDLLDDPEAIFRALAHFRRRGHDVVLLQILDPAELDLPFDGVSDFIDMETGERLEADAALIRNSYREALNNAIEGYRIRCGSLHVDFRVVTTERPPAELMSELLADRYRRGA